MLSLMATRPGAATRPADADRLPSIGTLPSMVVSIDKAGRIVIPKEVRDRLDLLPDTEMSIEIEGDSIRIERLAPTRRHLQWTDDGRPFFPASETQSLSDLDVQRLRDADRR